MCVWVCVCVSTAYDTLFRGLCLGLLDSEVQGGLLVGHEELAEDGVLVVCGSGGGRRGAQGSTGGAGRRGHGWEGGRARQALDKAGLGVRERVLRRASFWGIFGGELAYHPLHDFPSYYWNVRVWEARNIWGGNKKVHEEDVECVHTSQRRKVMEWILLACYSHDIRHSTTKLTIRADDMMPCYFVLDKTMF